MRIADDSYFEFQGRSLFFLGGECMIKILYVAIGGCIGSVQRYLISVYAPKLFGNFLPFGTLIVNAAGGFLIGF